MVREDVVDVATALGHGGLASIFPALDKKFFHQRVCPDVVVGDRFVRRYDVVAGWFPRQSIAGGELSRVQYRK